MAKSVVGSSLVKSAIYGRDPNWGRIAAAVGYADVKSDWSTDDMCISIGDTALMKAGQPLEYDAVAASQYMKDAGETHGTIKIFVQVGDGPSSALAWGCDLSENYIKINADYST